MQYCIQFTVGVCFDNYPAKASCELVFILVIECVKTYMISALPVLTM